MKKPTVLLIIVQFFLYVQTILGQGLNSDQIDSLVNVSMSTMPQAGVAVAVVQDGKVTHAKGYGVTSIASKEKVNENTLFAIASNSKAFTAAALAILVDEGKMSWDDKVVDHISEFKMYDPYVTANFNIQDLLTHRSGLGLGAGDLLFYPHGNDFTIDDVLKSFQYQKPVSAFRTKFDYDNLLYIVAGEVVTRVSGMSWAEFVQERIMKPLGMNHSAALFQNIKDKSNIALPHSSYKGELKLLDTYVDPSGKIGAAGGIYSSVSDLSKWLLMHLNGGRYEENLSEQLISEQNHAEMWKPQTNMRFNVKPEPPYKSHFGAYGLGWRISDANGYIIVEHSGGLLGMLSNTILIPELNAGVVVLTNTDPGGNSYWTISMEILDAFIGVERKDRIALADQWIQDMEAEGDSVLTAVWNIASNAKTDHLDFNDYAGVYRDNWFGNVEIKNENGKLWFRSLRSPKLNGEMFYFKANTFAIKWDYRDMECDAFASFVLDKDGKATSIKMKGISPNIDFSFDFHDLDLKRIEK